MHALLLMGECVCGVREKWVSEGETRGGGEDKMMGMKGEKG